MFSMLVKLPVKPGHLDDAVALLSTMMSRVREQAECRAFNVYTTDEPDVLWIHETYDSEADHDVHESYAEVKNVLAEFPQHLSGEATVIPLQPRLTR